MSERETECLSKRERERERESEREVKSDASHRRQIVRVLGSKKKEKKRDW